MNTAAQLVSALLEDDFDFDVKSEVASIPKAVYAKTTQTDYVPGTDYHEIENQTEEDLGIVFSTSASGAELVDEVVEFLKMEGVDGYLRSFRNVEGKLIEGWFSVKTMDEPDAEKWTFYTLEGFDPEEVTAVFDWIGSELG